MPGSIFVGYGLIEAANFYVDTEGNAPCDEHGYLDADLYHAWRSAQLAYEALTDRVADALQPSTPPDARPLRDAWIPSP